MSIRIPFLRGDLVDTARHAESVRAEMAVLTQRLGITRKKQSEATLEDEEEALVACYLDCLDKANFKRKSCSFVLWRYSFLSVRLTKACARRRMRVVLSHWFEISSYHNNWTSTQHATKTLKKAIQNLKTNAWRRDRSRENLRLALYSPYNNKKILATKLKAFYALRRFSRLKRESKHIFHDHLERRQRIEKLVDNIERLKIAGAESKTTKHSRLKQKAIEKEQQNKNSSSQVEYRKITTETSRQKGEVTAASDYIPEFTIAPRMASEEQLYSSVRRDRGILLSESSSSSGSSDDEQHVSPPSYDDVQRDMCRKYPFSREYADSHPKADTVISDAPSKTRLERQRELRRRAEEKINLKRSEEEKRKRFVAVVDLLIISRYLFTPLFFVVKKMKKNIP